MTNEKPERWCFAKADLQHPQWCRSVDQFIARVPGYEIGVVVQRNGSATNLWEDGVIGIPPEVAMIAEADESPMTRSGEPADEWRDVVCGKEGQFVGWKVGK
jgi:hypothetical protein